MTLGGALRPSIPSGAAGQRSSLTVLGRVLEAVRLRTHHSLWRLFGPFLSESPPRRHRRRNGRALRATRAARRAAPVDSASLTSERLVAHPVDFTSQRRRVDSNVVPYVVTGFVEELMAKPLLERLCIPIENFHFADLVKGTAENGDVIISGHIPAISLQRGSGMCLDEMGRQLSQLGLVAISACDTRRGDTFYVATNALMEEFDTHSALNAFNLTGCVRVIRLQAHDAQAEMELWSRSNLLCRMSVQYEVLSSWQEVLPTLSSLSTS